MEDTLTEEIAEMFDGFCGSVANAVCDKLRFPGRCREIFDIEAAGNYLNQADHENRAGSRCVENFTDLFLGMPEDVIDSIFSDMDRETERALMKELEEEEE